LGNTHIKLDGSLNSYFEQAGKIIMVTGAGSSVEHTTLLPPGSLRRTNATNPHRLTTTKTFEKHLFHVSDVWKSRFKRPSI
jgi:hypothetical protein